MPLTGTFLADFQSFFTAAQQAEQGLENIETQALATQTQIQRMTDRFTGQKVISEAAAMVEAVERIGGASKLTDAELQKVAKSAQEATAKLKAMGQDVPANMEKYAGMVKQTDTSMQGMLGTAKNLAGAFGVVFSVQSVVQFGQHVLATADNLTRLSDQTGMSVEEVQRLSYIAGQAGNDLGQLTAASSKLQDTLSTEAGQDAIEKLGLSFERIRAAKPYEQMRLIAEEIAKIPDPTARAQAAIDIFGRSGAQILPTLISDWAEVGKGATVASDQTVAALDAAGDAIDRFKGGVTTAAVQIAGSMIMAGEQIANQGLLATIGQWANSPNSALFLQQLADMRMAVLETEKTFAGLQNMAKGIATLDLSGTGPETPKERAAREKADAEAKRENEQRTKALAAAEAELKQVRMGTEGILAGINDETRAAVEADLALGASQATLATAYGLTKTQIAAIADVYKQNEKAAADMAKAEEQATTFVTKLKTEHAQQQATAAADGKQKELLALGTWRATTMQTLAETKGATIAQYEEVERVYSEKLTAMTTAHKAEADKRVQQAAEAYQAEMDAMVAAYEKMQGYKTDAEKKQKAVTDATERTKTAVRGLGDAYGFAAQTSEQYFALAAGARADSAANFMRPGGGAFVSSALYGSIQAKQAEDYTRRAQTLQAYEQSIANERLNRTTPWGNQNTLNVNVNNADAQGIANKLVGEMKHQGYRL